ncbi:MAG: sulfur carrier protein ThiS [bacterium]
MIEITVNGKKRSYESAPAIPGILAEIGAPERLVVVEVNGAVVYREDWEKTELRDGDRVEVVTFVGGG